MIVENKEKFTGQSSPNELKKKTIDPKKLEKWYQKKPEKNIQAPTSNNELMLDILKMREEQNGIKLGEKKIVRKKKKITTTDAFSSVDAHAWLVKNLNKDKTAASLMLTDLLKKGFLLNLTSSKLVYRDKDTYKWRVDERSPPLNMVTSFNDSEPPFPLITYLLEELINIQSLNLKASNNSIVIDYNSFCNSPEFVKFQKSTCRLSSLNLKDLKSKEMKLCFWINVYNLLFLHSLCKNPPPNNLKSTFFTNSSYLIGGNSFSLHDIYHGLLRGNTKNNPFGNPAFSSGDERFSHSVFDNEKNIDPRIHFVLFTGTTSSPNFQIMYPETCDAQLTKAVEDSLEEDFSIVLSKNFIQIPHIFHTYRSDFGKDFPSCFQFINKFIPEHLQRAARLMINANSNIKPKDFSWEICAPKIIS